MSPRLGSLLAQRMVTARAHERLDVEIHLRRRPLPDAWQPTPADDREEAPDRAEVIAFLKEEARESQSALLRDLGAAGDSWDALLRNGARGVRPLRSLWINNVLEAEVEPDALEELSRHPAVERIELTAFAPPEDLLAEDRQESFSEPFFGAAAARRKNPWWHVRRVGAPVLWRDEGLDGDGIVVAVIDSGLNYLHPDLASHMWDGGPRFPHHGWNFEEGTNDPTDRNGHGTEITGVVAGDGSCGVKTGIAPKARIMALRVGSSETETWGAFQFALEHGADVICLAQAWLLPHRPDRDGWRLACERLLIAGVLLAVSAGNEGQRLATYPLPRNIGTPADCPPPPTQDPARPQGGVSAAVACGATDSNDVLLLNSSRGPAAWETALYVDYPYRSDTNRGLLKPDLCAPGLNIKTCHRLTGIDPYAPKYDETRYTSAAAAVVAGCMALLVQAARRAGQPVRPARIQMALEASAVPLRGQTGKENDIGAGRVDVLAAFQYGRGQGWW